MPRIIQLTHELQRGNGWPPKAELLSAPFIFPTDTVYGIQGAWQSQAVCEQVCQLKKRAIPQFIILVRDVSDVKALAQVSEEQLRLLQHYWPGAISFILKKKNDLIHPMANAETLAFRVPQDFLLQKLLHYVGEPLISTSCNLKGEPPVCSVRQALEIFGERIGLYFDGGERRSGMPSTLVDLSTGSPRLIRQGDVRFFV